MDNFNSVNFHPHDKVLIGNCVNYYHGCWKRRCVVSNSLDAQRMALKEDVLAMIEEASKYEVGWLKRHVEVHKMSGNEGTIEELVSWVRSVRVFNRRATKRVDQDSRNMMNAKFN